MVSTGSFNLTAQYEEIGIAAARSLRWLESSHPSEVRAISNLRDFLNKYQEASLFVVGMTRENIDSLNSETERHEKPEDWVPAFRLPFPSMVLDFPEGICPALGNEPFLLFVDTLGDGTYYVEKLCTRRSCLRWAERIRLTDPARSLRLQSLAREVVELWEVSAFILMLDRQAPDQSSGRYNAEFISDCRTPVEPMWQVKGYSVFSVCKKLKDGGICSSTTPGCRTYRDHADQDASLLHAVLRYINRPDRFLVKVTPEKTAREKRLEAKKRVPSFAKKEMHVVLDHSQVREIVAAASAGSGHLSPLPHQRRGHWRELRADRFKEKGLVWVRPADINKGLTVKVKKSVYQVVS